MVLMSMTFDENFGSVPRSTLRLFKDANVSPADWDYMLARWGMDWHDEDKPWDLIEQHIESHRLRGSYNYPMYG